MGAKMTINESFYRKVNAVRLRSALEKSVRQTMYDLMRESMKEAPVDTGNLRRSHSIDVRLGSDMIEGLLKNSANYWMYVNFGTSRQDADDFVGRAVSKVNPGSRVSEYFDQYYKGE